MLDLKGTKVIELENGENLLLNYFLMSKKSVEVPGNVYGICVEKELSGEKEADQVENISYIEGNVMDILHTLMEHTVTPICLAEVLDDLMTERICG